MSLLRSGIAATVLALALLTGCAHDDMRTPIAVDSIGALPSLTAAQTRGLVSVPWTQPAPAVADQLYVAVPATACPDLRGVVVTETPRTVTLQVFATLSYCSAGAARSVVAPVRLPSPLGDRQLRHGPVMPAGAAIGTRPPAR